MTRMAILSDVHGNAVALDAVRKAIRSARPDVVGVGGDLVFNGPDPAAVVDTLREMESDGAMIVSGNTDIAVADFDYAAAFPWMTDGVPDTLREAAEWAHDALGDERVAWLRRLPAERRIHAEDGTMVLLCHASPGSQTAGFDQVLDANVTLERAARTEARVIACGHTHLPEVRDLGWKLIVNDGSAGYVFDGDPTASWALIDCVEGEVTTEIKRTEFDTLDGRQRDLRTRPAGRRLPGRHGPHGQARPMSDRRRVVVTGMGALTALGNDVASTWEGLVAGRSGVRTIDSFDPSRLSSRVAAEVRDFDASHVLDRKDLRRTDRYIQFGLVAARQALDQAGLPERFEGELAERTGVILGTGLGGVGTLIDGFSINALRGPDRISPFLIPMGIPNIGAGQIAINFGMTGPNFTTVSACATGGHALGESSEIIRRGDADIMVAGGAEAGIYEALVGGFASMRALSTRNDDPEGASRPFDGGRDGFVIGEGAGVVVLEALEHAEARGAAILAELVGYGATADASHITLPAPGGIGAVRAARRALEKAGLTPADIDHVNAHATSTPEGDKAELQAMKTILGDDAGRVSITANKSMLGHTLGAAGAIEAIVTVMTIRDGCVPPTINLVDPDPEAEGLDLTPNRAARQDVRTAISNSFGFGGQNTALIFRRWDA